MKPSQRVFFNTGAQVTRTFINVLLSLVAVRLLLNELGDSDYGIYSLVAGVTAMLAFITNALTSTTQRYLSYNQGNHDGYVLKTIFNNCLYLHLLVGLLLVIVLLSLTPFLFNGFLNIPAERICTARQVYYIVVSIVFLGFINAPFRASLFAHENIIYLSIIDLFDGVFKFAIAVFIGFIHGDKLLIYAFLLLGIQVFNLLALTIYCYFKFEECSLPTTKNLNFKFFIELISFTGWTIYSTACIVFRQQGLAILLNLFRGPIINAAYGIGFQVSGCVGYVSQSLMNAMNPQIMQAEGQGNRSRMLNLSMSLSKYTTILISIIGIPLIVEMPSILQWWLGSVPEYTVLFCRMTLLAAIVDTFTSGMWSVNYAIGDIKRFSLWVFTPKLLTIPFGYLLLYFSCPLIYIALLYILFEIISMLIRIPVTKRRVSIDTRLFVKEFLKPLLLPILISSLFSILFSCLVSFTLSFMLNIIISVIVYSILYYSLSITKEEKNLLNEIKEKVIKK